MAWVHVLDVGHGSCVSLMADDGKRWLFDCGHDGAMRPSAILSGNRIHRLFVLNYDEDHISDLPGLRRKYAIDVLTRNASITPLELALLKLESGPLSSAMCELLSGMGLGGGTSGSAQPVAPSALSAAGVSVTTFCNRYGVHDPERCTFADTNNISLVVFLHAHGLHMVLPGDLERAGWLALLRDPYFCAELMRVNVFIASHHGRESGYCEEVFDYCKPELVVMSDGEKQFESQEMTGIYAAKASGVVFGDGRRRKVLTTRCDGSLWFDAGQSRTTVDVIRPAPSPAPTPSMWDALAKPVPNQPFSLAQALEALAPPTPAAPGSLWEGLGLDPPLVKGWR